MKILALSDLHMEFPEAFMPDITVEGDLAILAGDIINPKGLRDFPDRLRKLTDQLHANFDKVIAIGGNHESYRYKYPLMLGYMEATYDQLGVEWLYNKCTMFKNKLIYGGIMWTDMNNGNPLVESHVRGTMNDYRLIRNWNGQFTVHDTISEFKKFKNNFPKSDVDIVISHHAPHELSIDPAYKNDYPTNYAYFATNMDSYLERTRLWIHGHMHSAKDYEVYGCRVVCNPLGYYTEGNTGFSQQLIELD